MSCFLLFVTLILTFQNAELARKYRLCARVAAMMQSVFMVQGCIIICSMRSHTPGGRVVQSHFCTGSGNQHWKYSTQGAITGAAGRCCLSYGPADSPDSGGPSNPRPTPDIILSQCYWSPCVTSSVKHR